MFSLFRNWMPREGKFFEFFQESAEQLVLCAMELQHLLADPANVETRSRNIKAIEHKADEITHRTVELLHTTFITPMDRDDIYQLITKMDDVVDYIEAASQRVFLYGIGKAPEEARQLAEICLASVKFVKTAVHELENLKNPGEILKACVEINRLENDADTVLRAAMASLFKNEPDVRQLIKLKEIFELLETVTDRCEDVANIIEGIVLEYA